MFGGLLLLALIVVVVVAVTRARRDRPDRVPGEPPGTGVRRFFEMVLLLASGGFAAVGVAGLVAQLLPGPEVGTATMARSLAFTVVGVPASVVVGAVVRRRLRSERERRSFAWRATTTLSLTGTVVAVMPTGIRSLAWLFGAADASPFAAGVVIVGTACWVPAWIGARRTTPPGALDLHVAAGSAAGLAALAVGGAGLAGAGGAVWYARSISGSGIGAQGDVVGWMAACTLVGAVVFGWYWIGHGLRAERSPVWRAEVLLVGVLGGVVALIVALGVLVDLGLVWWLGDPGVTSAARHFAAVPRLLPVGAVGMASWWYHRAVLRRRPEGPRMEADRLYDYLLAAAALVTGIVGATVAIVAAVEAAAATGNRDVSVANTTITGLTLLTIGVGVWVLCWSGIRRHVARDPAGEAASVVRRAYLLVLFGLTGIVSLIALIVGVVRVFRDVLEGRAGRDTVTGIEVAIAMVVSTGLTALFHGFVYRSDRRRIAAGSGMHLVREVILMSADAPELAGLIAGGTGARVRIWPVLATHAAGDATEVVRFLEAGGHPSVVVTGDSADGYRVIEIDR